MSELTERLREGMIWIPELHEFEETETQRLMEQAADALEAQEAKMAEAAAKVDQAASLLQWLCGKSRENIADKAFLRFAHDEVGVAGLDLLSDAMEALTPSLPK